MGSAGGRALAPRSPAALLLGAALLSSSCAGLDQEKHVAPLFTEVSTSGGGTEVEALGGAVVARRPAPTKPFVHRAFRPIFLWDRLGEDVTLTRFLVPLGRGYEVPSEKTWRLLPIFHYQRDKTKDEWTFFALPGIYWAKRDDRILRAWFPFGGVFERSFSFDRLEFVLWPIWMKTERQGRRNYHVLWPVFGYSEGRGGPSWHVWPLYGRSRIEQSWDRFYVLWPFFHWQENFLPEGKRETKWMFFPFVGRTRRGDYRSTTVLWPFFGLARDPSTGFWAWDGPWPLVRFQRGGRENYRRTRVWPLYSYYRGDHLESEYVFWPLIGRRHTEFLGAERDLEFVVPFWQDQRQIGPLPEEAQRWRKLWPFFQLENRFEYRRFAFPALNPLWRTTEVEQAYSWIYELFTEERGPKLRRQRSWLGLWRREVDAYEDRKYLTGLWSHRTYTSGGERCSETSLVFGLIRWRSSPSDPLEWLRPALPGPGWPIERSTELMERE